MVASHVPPTEDLACNTGMCPDWESNQQLLGSQAHAESTELHQPGLEMFLKQGKHYADDQYFGFSSLLN